MKDDRVHFQIVADRHAVEVKFSSQQSIQDELRKSRWKGAIQRGIDNVSGHDRRDTGPYRRFKRQKLSAKQCWARSSNDGENLMTVLRCVAMSWKVFRATDHPLLLVGLHCRRDESGNIFWIFSKRPRADDGVSWICVDIGHRREIQIDADRLKLLRHRLGLRLDKAEAFCLSIDAAEIIVTGKKCERRTEAGDSSPFLIDADKGRAVPTRPRNPRRFGRPARRGRSFRRSRWRAS